MRDLSLTATLLALLLTGACCPPLTTDYSSPESTLLGWQSHLCHDDPDGEYRCLSDGFKQRTGNWQTYYSARNELLDAEPLLAALLSRADLSSRIVEQHTSEDGLSATLDIDVGDDDTTVAFVLETTIFIDLIDGPPLVSRTSTAVAASLRSGGGRQWLEFTGARPELRLTDEQRAAIVGVRMEQRWVIDDIEGLIPMGALAP